MLGIALLTGACGGTTSSAAGSATPPAPSSLQATSAQPSSAQPTTSRPASPASSTSATEPPTADELAGVLSRTVAERGNGATLVVPGSQPAPGEGEEHSVRVEVEGGLDVDREAFARFVLDTLNDPRSWSHDGLTFSRTDGDADVVVVLASPETSAAMCEPLVTYGKLSCRRGPQAIITMYRWVNGMEDYGDDLTGYRQYVVNHEVGHVLGHGHESCPAAGEPAPVMQQQTKDVDPCEPNAWPYP